MATRAPARALRDELWLVPRGLNSSLSLLQLQLHFLSLLQEVGCKVVFVGGKAELAEALWLCWPWLPGTGAAAGLQEGGKAALKMGKGVKIANFEGLWALGRLKGSFPSPTQETITPAKVGGEVRGKRREGLPGMRGCPAWSPAFHRQGLTLATGLGSYLL